MRGCIAVMTVIAVVVQYLRDHLGDGLEDLLLTGRNVQIERIILTFQLDDRDGSRRQYRAIEVEYRFLICAKNRDRSIGRRRGHLLGREEAFRRLRRYWGKVGFTKIDRGDGRYGLSPARRLPTMGKLCPRL